MRQGESGLGGPLGPIELRQLVPAGHKWHAPLMEALAGIPDVKAGDSVWWHCDMIHSVAPVRDQKGWGNVMYIPAAPWCPRNERYASSVAAAFLTAFYAGRMVFRTFYGEQAPEAEQLMRGELAHGEHRNPATGEEEDTDVGFPGPEHHIAERAPAMRLAMAPLGLLATIAGFVGIPGATHSLETFLDPTFAGSKFADA